VFSWVAPVGAPVVIRPAGPLTHALGSPAAARVENLLALLKVLTLNPSVQATVAPIPATVEALAAVGSPTGQATLAALRTLAAQTPHRLLNQPYVPVNLGSLSKAGVTEEIAGQTERALAVMRGLFAPLPAAQQPSPSYPVWVTSGAVSPAISQGLGLVHARDLVLPDADLPPATEQAHATWAQPFELPLSRGSVTAGASDSPLSSYFSATEKDPVLAATQLLADLAMIHFEIPYARDPRGVIAVPPASWDPNPLFVSTLVAGLSSSPVVTTATLEQFFGGAVPVGGNSAAPTRRLVAAAATGDIGAGEAAAIVAARNQINGFTAAVGTDPPQVANRLEDLLLASESSELSPSAQRAGLATFQRNLASQLAGISVITTTVTLTARTASVPITILSSLGYHMNATLTLSSGKLQFPQGATRTVHIDHPTNSTNVEVRARTTGDLALSYKLTSKLLVIAHGRLTVRSTATSVVGIVLTAVAAVVLIGWWARTWRRSRRLRRTRAPRGAGG
jgi:hypothetical protein